MMEEFLKTVARHYLDLSRQQARATGQPDTLPLTRYLFCFPNRRSGLFFARHLQQLVGGPCCAPAMTTVSDLFGQFSTRRMIDRTALLFRLYEVYGTLIQGHDSETFDQFVFWGDMLLSDFDDVDKYLVNADQLFANVRDLKEIDARFAGFTPEQVAVIRSFWESFRPEVEYAEGDKHQVFGRTWAILAQLYHEFRRVLMQRNEAYAGMMEREVLEQLLAVSEGDPFGALPYDKVVFVGLTAISKADRQLMALLKLHGHAEFCWDYADPRLQPQSSRATSATFFTRSNLQDFGNALSDAELQRGLVPDAQRQVSLYAVASGVGQTQLARSILEQWKAESDKEGQPRFDPFRTAVVLPDEKLLLPMLYAVPQALGSFNVTMGYSLKATPVASLVSYLMALQQTWREGDGTFYYRQVLTVLSHPYTISMAGQIARVLANEITGGNNYHVPVQKLAARHPFLSQLFRHVSSATEALDYLLDTLQQLMERAAEDIRLADASTDDDEEAATGTLTAAAADGAEAGGIAAVQSFGDTDYEFIYHYHKVVASLARQVSEGSSTQFLPKTLFMLLDRLAAGVSVPFQGEPLNGLQVMGVLETRSLDFDDVIILSMNEGVFPAKPSQNTFVPMSLRDAFGMPTQRHRDSIFAYHFYRLFGRARRVVMIYDSRTEGMQTGEESRYVKQLRYLMGYDKLEAQTQSDDIRLTGSVGFEVPKTPAIMTELRRCLGQEGDRVLSASALKRYIQCPMQFYLGFVRGLHADDDLTEGLDAMHFGDILHHVMQKLYSETEGRSVARESIRKYIDNPDHYITPLVYQEFRDVAKVESVEGYNQLLAQLIVGYVVRILRQDEHLCPFRYLKGEGKHTFIYEAAPELPVRIKCVYDRLDMPDGQPGVLRVVDYKTGNSGYDAKRRFPDVASLFSPEGKGSSEAFQVMLYCHMLGKATSQQLASLNIRQAPERLQPHLYFVRDFRGSGAAETLLAQHADKQDYPVTDYARHRPDFDEALRQLLVQIFDPDVPFTQCAEGSASCKHCDFAHLCGRVTS